jgi:pyridoxine 5-phosphate synthase
MELIRTVKPTQATLVPDPPHVLTSNAGWDTIRHANQLKAIIEEIKDLGVRTSIFVEPDADMVAGAVETGVDRIELYTESYATGYDTNRQAAVAPYVEAAGKAYELGIGINAGHDLNLYNLQYFVRMVPHVDEVSIGHALICDALYLGLENAIQAYREACR